MVLKAKIALNEPGEEGTVHVNHIEEMPVSDSDLLFFIPIWTGNHTYTNWARKFQEVLEYYLKLDIM